MAEGNRRHPQNLQGVLQLAVEAGSASDGPAPNEPMSQEVTQDLRVTVGEGFTGRMRLVDEKFGKM